MLQPPGSESQPLDALDVALDAIAVAGLFVQPAKPVLAWVTVLIVQIIRLSIRLFGRHRKRAELDLKTFVKEIENELLDTWCSPRILRWSAKRAGEILTQYGGEPIKYMSGLGEGTRIDAGWMAEYVIDYVKDKDLDPGSGKEQQCTYRILRSYYDVYLHHGDVLAQIGPDVLEYYRKRLNELPIELRRFVSEIIFKHDLRKAERNCYVPGGLPSPELSLFSITAKYGVIPFYDTQQFKDVYERIKQAERPMLLVITGEGGSGKTRLAIELGRRLREEGWRYCFIAANDGDDDLRPLFSHDATPIFAVADYALRIQRRVVKFVSAAAKEGWHDKPFCLALLDRKTPAYVSELEKPTDSDPDGVGQKIPFNQIHVALKSLEEDEARALFDSAVRELARHYELALPPDIEEKWLLLRKSAHLRLRPLNVTLGALLAVRGTLERPLSDEEILSAALRFEVNGRWMAQGMEEDAIPRAMDVEQGKEYELALKLLAAYVVLRGHTEVSELQQAATELITPSLFPYVGDGKAHQLAILLCKMLPKTGHPRFCIPLEPDPVADYLITSLRDGEEDILRYVIVNLFQTQDGNLIEQMLEVMWRAMPVVGEREAVREDSGLGGIRYCADILYNQISIENFEEHISYIEETYGCQCNSEGTNPTLLCLLYLYLYKKYIANNEEVLECTKKIKRLLGDLADERSNTYILERAHSALSEYRN